MTRTYQIIIYHLRTRNCRCLLKRHHIQFALSLAKQCRPLDDENFFLKLTSDVLCCCGEKCQEAVKLLGGKKLVNIYIMQPKTLINCKYFSISLDESIDLNICQLIIYINKVNANLNCFEFKVVALHGHVAGQALFDAIDSKIFKF